MLCAAMCSYKEFKSSLSEASAKREASAQRTRAFARACFAGESVAFGRMRCMKLESVRQSQRTSAMRNVSTPAVAGEESCRSADTT